MYHTLKDHYNVQQRKKLGKLDPVCVNKSFEEIREEGFSDDGLFDNMKEFFLPLTISEDELYMRRENYTISREEHEKKKSKLDQEIEYLKSAVEDQNKKSSEYDGQFKSLQDSLKTKIRNYSKEKSNFIEEFDRKHEPTQTNDVLKEETPESQLTPSANNVVKEGYGTLIFYKLTSIFFFILSFFRFPAKKSLEEPSIPVNPLHELQRERDNQLKDFESEWNRKCEELVKEIQECQILKNKADKDKKTYDIQLDEKRNQLKNVEFELSKKQTMVKKKLVKPHRGFIMFGPPGKIDVT